MIWLCAGVDTAQFTRHSGHDADSHEVRTNMQRMVLVLLQFDNRTKYLQTKIKCEQVHLYLFETRP